MHVCTYSFLVKLSMKDTRTYWQERHCRITQSSDRKVYAKPHWSLVLHTVSCRAVDTSITGVEGKGGGQGGRIIPPVHKQQSHLLPHGCRMKPTPLLCFDEAVDERHTNSALFTGRSGTVASRNHLIVKSTLNPTGHWYCIPFRAVQSIRPGEGRAEDFGGSGRPPKQTRFILPR